MKPVTIFVAFRVGFAGRLNKPLWAKLDKPPKPWKVTSSFSRGRTSLIFRMTYTADVNSKATAWLEFYIARVSLIMGAA